MGRWSWIGELGWSGSLVVDRWAGMKWVVGCGSAAEVGRWSLVVVGLWLRWLRWWFFLNGFAPVGFKSTGFQIGGVGFKSTGFHNYNFTNLLSLQYNGMFKKKLQFQISTNFISFTSFEDNRRWKIKEKNLMLYFLYTVLFPIFYNYNFTDLLSLQYNEM